MRQYVRQFLVAVLVFALGFAGNYLMKIKTTNLANINFDSQVIRVNNTEVINLILVNNSEFAIDSLFINPSFDTLILAKYELSSKETNKPAKTNWMSPLLIGESLKCLFVVKSKTEVFKSIDLNDFIKGKRKDSTTLNWVEVPIKGGRLPIDVIIYKGFWLFLPFIVVGGIIFLIEKFWRKKENPQSPPASPPANPPANP